MTPIEDEPGRLLIIGDIHGCDVALDTLLDSIDLTPADRVVQLGDVIDRGPNTRAVIDRLIEIDELCRFTMILGNHEEMLFTALNDGDMHDDWLASGGLETLHSYGGGAEHVSARHIEFLRHAINYWEHPATVCVHANLEPGRSLALQDTAWLRWHKLTKQERRLDTGQRVVCGHTPQKDGLPWVGNGWICIDTYVYGSGYLTCLDLTHELFYQANQAGESRGPVPIRDVERLAG